MKELRFILFTIVTLTLTGIVIVSCATTKPANHLPDLRAERNPYNPPVLVTNSLPAPPLPSGKPVAPLIVKRTAVIQSNTPLVILPPRPHITSLAFTTTPNRPGFVPAISNLIQARVIGSTNTWTNFLFTPANMGDVTVNVTNDPRVIGKEFRVITVW